MSETVTAPMGHHLIGRWRIVEANIWEREHLDLVESAIMVIELDCRGAFAFGTLQAGLDLEYSRTLVFFTWQSLDEGDEVSGSESLELQDDGTIEIELVYHLGDEAILKAERITSPIVC